MWHTKSARGRGRGKWAKVGLEWEKKEQYVSPTPNTPCIVSFLGAFIARPMHRQIWRSPSVYAEFSAPQFLSRKWAFGEQNPKKNSKILPSKFFLGKTTITTKLFFPGKEFPYLTRTRSLVTQLQDTLSSWKSLFNCKINIFFFLLKSQINYTR